MGIKGHSWDVGSIAFSPDGSTLATGSGKTTRLWTVGGELLQTLSHSHGVNGVAFSPDGSILATASDDWTGMLWTKEGRLLQTLKGHSGCVTSIAFSPDGSILITGSADHTVREWSVRKQSLFQLHHVIAQVCPFSCLGANLRHARMSTCLVGVLKQLGGVLERSAHIEAPSDLYATSTPAYDIVEFVHQMAKPGMRNHDVCLRWQGVEAMLDGTEEAWAKRKDHLLEVLSILGELNVDDIQRY